MKSYIATKVQPQHPKTPPNDWKCSVAVEYRTFIAFWKRLLVMVATNNYSGNAYVQSTSHFWTTFVCDANGSRQKIANKIFDDVVMGTHLDHMIWVVWNCTSCTFQKTPPNDWKCSVVVEYRTSATNHDWSLLSLGSLTTRSPGG